MQFFGEYRNEIENGRVEFPWIVASEEKLVWVITEITKDGHTATHCKICSSDDESINGNGKGKQNTVETRIIAKGEFLLDEEEMWSVPKEILQYLKNDEIIFVGMFAFAEIMSSKDMQSCENYLTEIMNSLEDMDML